MRDYEAEVRLLPEPGRSRVETLAVARLAEMYAKYAEARMMAAMANLERAKHAADEAYASWGEAIDCLEGALTLCAISRRG